jgi:RimJ/RimL family protein N-acetyltransferase
VPILVPPVVVPGSLGGSRQPAIVVDAQLVLRPWRADDAPTVRDAYDVADIQHWHFRRHDSHQEAEAWIATCWSDWSAERAATWAIAGRHDDEVLGRVTLYLVLAEGYAEVSYWVLPWARNRGVATRVVVASTAWAHGLGLHRVQLQHSTRNAASGRVAEKAAFTSEGVRRGAQLLDDGWHDMHVYAHLATDPHALPPRSR